MHDFLLFRLYGPLASWGGPAVGELRPTAGHPGRSAVLGLLGACLGVERADEDGQRALALGYGVAVRVDAPGLPTEDYHTVQAPRARRGFAPVTRRQELVQDTVPIETMVTRRTYLADAVFSVAVWARADARWSLTALAEALRAPVFMPYLGRKSCPLALPPAPLVTSAEGLLPALAEADAAWRAADAVTGFAMPPRRGAPRLAWDTDLPGPAPLPDDVVRDHVRRDQPVHRGRWQFRERTERSGLLDLPAGEGR